MKPIVASVSVTSGKLYIRNRRKFDEIIAGLGDFNGTLTLEKNHATRSKAQNDYYHAVVVARVAGKLKKDVKLTHELLKAQFLPHDMAAKGTNGVLMNGFVIGGSTTRLNKLQFIEYLEQIVMWAAEKWELYIPDPDPAWREKAMAEQSTEAA